MNRIIRFNNAGNADVLEMVQEVPRSPEAEEVLVQISAIGLNRAEILFRQAQYVYPPEYPSRIGLEAVGIINALGSEVKDFAVGDRVVILSTVHQPREGTYGDHVTVKVTNIMKATENSSDVEEAGIWNAYLTSYGALFNIARLTKGQSVLLPAAASSVGLAAIALAKNAGAQSIATTRNPDKKQALLDAGADFVVVTSTESVINRVLEVTNQAGVDIIFDPIAGTSVQKFINVLRPAGHYIVYGALGGMTMEIPMLQAFQKLLNLRVYSVYELIPSPKLRAEAEAYLRPRFQEGQLSAHIGKTFGLSQVAEAHRYMESNRHVGKIILTTKET